MAAALRQLIPSLDMLIITTDGYYAETPAVAEAKIPTVRLRALPRTTRSLPRLIFTLIEGRRLVRYALASADIVVTISDPPLCELWMKQGDDRPLWIHWPMDLYPEVFEAAGLAKPGSWVLRWLTSRLRLNRPDLVLAISPFQAQLLARRNIGRDLIVMPCGVKGGSPALTEHSPVQAEKLTFICCGNAGQGFASEFLFQFASRLDPERYRLLVSLRGTQAFAIRKKLLAEAPAVEWYEWLPEETLICASAHIVAQLPAWAGISVPSRAVTALTLSRPLIAAGARGSDLNDWGQRAGWFFPLSDGGEADGPSLDTMLAALTTEALAMAADRAAVFGAELRGQRYEGIRKLARWIARRTGLPLEDPVADGLGQGDVTPDRLDVGHKAARTTEPGEIVG
ncbi:glycosyltransferase [Radicibacter daui]|uniref:glycosyltransferase n=1 Tax=Radicibacter daui TaxID=3064829 RepID=UPI004046964D